jgi:beta-xylosidase
VKAVRWLAGFTRVTLAPGESARVTFRLHADRTAFTGRDGMRMVEPGAISVGVGGASDDLPLAGEFTLVGPVRGVGPGRVLTTPVSVRSLAGEDG